jgi:translation initiation factor 4G
VTFGSIENSSAPVSSSTITPVVKQEGVKSFGTVAVNTPSGHVNGKASISSRSSVVNSGASLSTNSTTASSTASLKTASRPVATSPAPPDPTSSKVNLDVKKLFQNPQGPTTSSSLDTSSPAARNTSLTQPSSTHQSQPHPPSQLGPHQYSFPPNSIRQGQHGSNGTPRSPSFSRPMPNGTGPRPQGGQTGGPPATGLPSPRLGPHALNNQASGLPPPQMSMQPTMSMWPPTYYVSYFVFFSHTSYVSCA